MNNFISIIIPVFNRNSLIKETLESVIEKYSSQWESIVVDDGSTDDTVEVIKALAETTSKIKLLQRPDEHFPGGNGARNYGALNAKGAYLLFLDSDDLLSEGCVKKRLDFVNDHQEIDFFIQHTGVFKKKIGDSKLLWNQLRSHQVTGRLIERFINQDMPWHTSGVLWDAQFFKNTGMWLEDLGAWQDWELHLRVLLSNPNYLIYSSSPDNFYRQDDRSQVISSATNLNRYLSNVMVAINAIHRNDITKQVDQQDFQLLFKRTLLEYPIKKGYRLLPLQLTRKSEYPSGLLSKTKFLMSYLIVLLSWVTIIRKGIKKMGGTKWLLRYQKNNTFLKIPVNGNYK